MITWSFVEALENPKTVEMFEADYGITFPEAYKEVVRKYNNGYPSKNVFSLPSGERCILNHLYSFNRSDAENMWDFNSHETLKEEGFVAFADDSFGNPIGFRLADGAVVVVDYDTEETVEIAKDFSALLCQLRNAAE